MKKISQSKNGKWRVVEAKEKPAYTTTKNGFKFEWYGGHGVNVYNENEEIDFFNVGSFSKDAATLEEVKAGIAEYLADIMD